MGRGSEALIARWTDPKFRVRVAAGNAARWADPVRREAFRIRMNDPVTKAKMRAAQKLVKHNTGPMLAASLIRVKTTEWRIKVSKQFKGRSQTKAMSAAARKNLPSWKDRKHTPEHNAKIRAALNTPEMRAENSRKRKGKAPKNFVAFRAAGQEARRALGRLPAVHPDHGGRCSQHVRRELPSVIGLDCVYCGAPATNRDHVVPVRRGGCAVGNLVPACRRCNISKGARTPDEWLAGGLLAS